MITAAVLVAVLAVAFANGANDNFKGVATLHGTGSLAFRPALWLATATTLAGSLAAILLGTGLAHRFSGKGLVPDAVAAEPTFLLAVALGAAITVLLATRLGFPVSTTHALTGGLAGAGLALAGPRAVATGPLLGAFLLPLVLSPLVSLVLAASLRPVASRLEARLPQEPACICAAPTVAVVHVPYGALALTAAPSVGLEAGLLPSCRRHGAEPLVAVRAGSVLHGLHVASAGAVGFARGLNDAPKIAGLLVGLGALAPAAAVSALAVTMALGGLLSARRVAQTLSFGITPMSGPEGLAANLVTAGLVMLASPLGLPVSTTHVSCGALFGIGAANGEARWRMVAAIAGAWAITLPVAAAASALVALAFVHAR